MNTSLPEIAKELLRQDKITVISHRAPDGDTLGSALALVHGLRKLGKSADFLCSDHIPQKYLYLFEGMEELIGKKEDPFAAAEGRFLVSVDIADTPLFGDLQILAEKIDVCIDHHRTDKEFGAMVYRDPTAAATGEILYELLREMDVPMDEKIAACLYTAITTDTGCFKYNNTTPRTYRIAADLVELGAPAPEINRLMFDTISRQKLELQKLALETLEYHFDNLCVFMVISREMMAKAGAKGEDVEGINAIPRQIDGALVGVTIRERKSGGYKISMRSQPAVDSSEICGLFGGGGHIGAAGCVFDDPLDIVKQKLETAIGAYLKEHDLLKSTAKE